MRRSDYGFLFAIQAKGWIQPSSITSSILSMAPNRVVSQVMV